MITRPADDGRPRRVCEPAGARPGGPDGPRPRRHAAVPEHPAGGVDGAQRGGGGGHAGRAVSGDGLYVNVIYIYILCACHSIFLKSLSLSLTLSLTALPTAASIFPTQPHDHGHSASAGH
jgi:hypothetical protein